MGYDVHITRTNDRAKSEVAPITMDEWLQYAASDPEMRLDNVAEAEVGQGEVLQYENDGLAIWTAYTGSGSGVGKAWFDYRRGKVVVKNPDDEILGKMRRIAAALGAKVIGEAGEIY